MIKKSVLIFVSGHQQKPICEEDILFLTNHVALENQKWLHAGKAFEINTTSNITQEFLQKLRNEYFNARQIDVFCIPHESETRRKKLLLADMDATIVEAETLDELAAEAGIKDKIATITARAMRGELDFHAALTERVAMLENLSVSALQKTLDRMVINAGAETLVKTMRKHGAECYLVSGGFTFFTGAIADKCGFNGHHGNTLDIKNEKLTGKVIPPILDKDAKRNFLKHYTQKLNLTTADTMAVGDGANDIPMLLAAGLGVGYRPKPAVKDNLENNIVHTDLTSLLYIQGYTEADFA